MASALDDQLSFLLWMHRHSLSRYLAKASPYIRPDAARHWARIRPLADRAASHEQLISDLMREREIIELPQSAPSDLARFAYVSLEHLLPLLIVEKRDQIAAYDRGLLVAGDDVDLAEALGELLENTRFQLSMLREIEGKLKLTPA